MSKKEMNQQLLEASQNGELPRVQDALDRGADVQAKDDDCKTALDWASGNGHEKVAALLLDRGADVQA